MSTYTIWCVLHDAGFTWDRDRSWCETGTAIRKRKSGTVTVVDPDTIAKKPCKERGSWKGVHQHASFGVPTDDEALRAFNDAVQEAVPQT